MTNQNNNDPHITNQKEKLYELMLECVQNPSYESVATLLMTKYESRFVCASVRYNQWYEFKNHKWSNIDSFVLRDLISGDLTEDFNKIIYAPTSGKSNLFSKLNNSTFKGEVIKKWADLTFDSTFLAKLDENINLICFTNGVYDLSTGIFRDGLPEDYISLCTHYDYIEFDRDNQYIKEIKSFFKKIQPDKTMREYLLTLLSGCLDGSTYTKNLYILAGSRSGRSSLISLMRYTMGDLFKYMDVNLLMRNTGSKPSTFLHEYSGTLVDKKGVRFCCFDEIYAKTETNHTFVKIFSQPMTIARSLFREEIFYRPQMKPYLLCDYDKLPIINEDIDINIKIIPFKNNISMIDKNFQEKIFHWKQFFMSILLQYYKNYTVNGLIHPQVVIDETIKYYPWTAKKIFENDRTIKSSVNDPFTTNTLKDLMATLLMIKFKSRFVCASIEYNQWYEFKNHKWEEIDHNYILRPLIYMDLEDFNKIIHIRISEKSKLYSKFNNSRIKDEVIKKWAVLAFDHTFLEKLDENINLICFTNGVYDLSTGIFRNGLPEDCISLCTGYDYIEFDRDNQYIKEIETFFEKIQPDKTMRDYLLTLLSTCLDGSTSKENLYILAGSACGRSSLLDLMRNTMGDLVGYMDVNLLMDGTDTKLFPPDNKILTKPISDVSNKKGVRLCLFSESLTKKEVDRDFIQIFTQPMIMARPLYRVNISFRPQMKPFFMSTYLGLPVIHEDNDVSVKIIPFKNQIMRAHEKNLAEKFFHWKQFFMSILLQYYKIYIVNGLIHPPVVIDETIKHYPWTAKKIFENNQSIKLSLKNSITIDTIKELYVKQDGYNYVSDAELDEVRELVYMLSHKRYSDYISWYFLGKCMHNIDHRLLYDWTVLARYSYQDQNVCTNLWQAFKDQKFNYGIVTLHHYAMTDDPESYQKMKKIKLDNLIDSLSAEITDVEISKLLMEKYGFIYKCISNRKHKWFEFKNHRWQNIDILSHKNQFFDEISKIFGDRQKYYEELSINVDDISFNQLFINKYKKFSRAVEKICQIRFRHSVMSKFREMAFDHKFLDKLDENVNMICFTNGVYDLSNKYFRDGCPEDYISLCTNFDYVKYEKYNNHVREIKTFFKNMQPDKTMRNYLLTVLSRCLCGSNSDQNIFLLLKSYANGTSSLMNLMHHTFGDLYKEMDKKDVVVNEKRFNGPNFTDMKGVRICFVANLKKTDNIDTSINKIYAGGDLLIAKMFGEAVTYKPQFKEFLILEDHNEPIIKSSDLAIWRRVYAIPLYVRFVCPYVKGQNLVLADASLGEKIPKWGQMFMSMLISRHHKYQSDTLNHPKLVIEETEKYRERCEQIEKLANFGSELRKISIIKTSPNKSADIIHKLNENIQIISFNYGIYDFAKGIIYENMNINEYIKFTA